VYGHTRQAGKFRYLHGDKANKPGVTRRLVSARCSHSLSPHCGH